MNHAFKKILDLTNNPTRKFSKENVYVTSFFTQIWRIFVEKEREKEKETFCATLLPLQFLQVPWEQGLSFHKTTSVLIKASADNRLFLPKCVDK